MYDTISKLSQLIKGLEYISETDEPVEIFAGGKMDQVSAEAIASIEGFSADTNVEEALADQFFSRLIKVMDGYSERRRQLAIGYAKLKDLFDSDLKSVKVFRFGRINIDIYVVGLDLDGNLVGIKTKALET